MKIDLVNDGFWGSCGKGGIAGYMAKRFPYTAVVCAYGTQAGHTYNDRERGIHMMVQQLPVGISSPHVRGVFIGPGALIHADTLRRELRDYGGMLAGKRIFIHEHAAVVEDYHSEYEHADGRTKMGSTAKGVGEAAIERIRRKDDANVVKNRWKGTDLEQYIADRFTYLEELTKHTEILVEGAQGFGLSMYHGEYPFVTSRDVSPWQICGDCGLPFSWASDIRVVSVCRTHPIRVNNRDGSSGPAYPGQKELIWSDVGVDPELTTVTKLPRRVFEWSHTQMQHASVMCASASHPVALTFADYCRDKEELSEILESIFNANDANWISYVVAGPDDSDVFEPESINSIFKFMEGRYNAN